MGLEITSSPLVDNYFNEIKEHALRNSHTFYIANEDYDAKAPELFFTKCILSMGILMAERTKTRMETIANRKCEKCPELCEKLEKSTSKLMDITRKYNGLVSLLHNLDPIQTQAVLDSQAVSVSSSPTQRGGSGKSPGRAPLTPVKVANTNIKIVGNNNVIKEIPSAPSPNRRRPMKKNDENCSETIYSNNAVLGSPLHSSTQSSSSGKFDFRYDENIKIKNSLTPKKKTKEISPLKKSTPMNNVLMTPMGNPHTPKRENITPNSKTPNNVPVPSRNVYHMVPQVFAHHIESSPNDSVEVLPETPPNDIFCRNLKKEKIVPNNVVNVIDIDDVDQLSPVFIRYSDSAEQVTINNNTPRTPERHGINEHEDSFGIISPSIMSSSSNVRPRNLMHDSLGALGEDTSAGFSRVSSLPKSSTVKDVLPNTSAGRKGKEDWVHTGGTKKNLSTSNPFKYPGQKAKTFKQMTLPQMNKNANKKKSVAVDISTLEEFNGGTRPKQNSGKSKKRKSDEGAECEITAEPNGQQNRRKAKSLEIENADATTFDEFLSEQQDVQQQSSSKQRNSKRGKKELNVTSDFIAGLDILPNRDHDTPEPRFAYKADRAIRKKEDRAKLKGWDCDDCRAYYEAMRPSDDEDPAFLQNLKDQCSKHRAKHPANINGTPPGFWELDFPSTMELKRTKAFRTESFVHSDED